MRRLIRRILSDDDLQQKKPRESQCLRISGGDY